MAGYLRARAQNPLGTFVPSFLIEMCTAQKVALPEAITCTDASSEVLSNYNANVVAPEERRRKVLLNLVESAIKVASTVANLPLLFQRRAGRAVYALSEEAYKYACRWGIVFAQSVLAAKSQWVPISAEWEARRGAIQAPMCIERVAQFGASAPLDNGFDKDPFCNRVYCKRCSMHLACNGEDIIPHNFPNFEEIGDSSQSITDRITQIRCNSGQKLSKKTDVFVHSDKHSAKNSKIEVELACLENTTEEFNLSIEHSEENSNTKSVNRNGMIFFYSHPSINVYEWQQFRDREDPENVNHMLGFSYLPWPITTREVDELNNALDALSLCKYDADSASISFHSFVHDTEMLWKCKRSFEPCKYYNFSEKQLAWEPRCPNVHHELQTWRSAHFKQHDAFYLFECLYCTFKSLQEADLAERHERACRIFDFNQQFVEVPPPEIKKGGVSKVIPLVWGAFAAKHTKASPKNDNVSFPCAQVHSGREEEEERADLHDRAENEQAEHGAPTISSAIEILRAKKKRGKKNASKILEYGEGRYRGNGIEIVEKDVFTQVRHGSSMDRALNWLGRNRNGGILTQQTWPTRSEDVLRPRNIKNCIYTPLPQFSEEQLRVLLDKQDMKSSGITAIDLAIQSHVAEGTPMMAFCTIMDGDNGDPNIAALSGSKFDLGRDRCQVITLPLVNVNLNHMHRQVNEGNKSRLYLATLLNDTCGVYENVPIFSYGTSQLLEHRPDAYTNQTLCKEEWMDIENRNARKGARILKGFNVNEHIAADYDQELIAFPEDSKLQCKPRDIGHSNFAFSSRGIVERHPATRLDKSCSLRFGREGRQASVFGYSTRHQNFVDDNVDTTNLTGARHSFAHSTSEDDNNIFETVCINEYTVPKDAKAGYVIGTLNVYKEIRSQKLLPYHSFLSKGMVSATLSTKFFCGGNPFMGTTICIVIDAFGRIDADGALGGSIPNSILNCSHMLLHPLSQGGERELSFDLGSLMGHNFFPLAKAFANPQLIFCIYDDNDVEAAASWKFTNELKMKRLDPTYELVTTPTLSFPYTTPDIIKIDIWGGLGKIKLGVGYKCPLFPLSFARRSEYAPRQYVLGTTQALLGVLQGYGGTIKGRLIRTSTTMVTCNVRIFIWGLDTDPTLADVAQYPHQDINFERDSGEFELKVQSPFSKVSSKVVQSTLWVWPIGGPIAPAEVVSSFNFAVYIDSITPDQQLSMMVRPDRKYAWCVLSDFPKQAFALRIKGFVSDVEFKKTQVKLLPNPLSHLFATCGFFGGKITVYFDWSFGEALTVGATTLDIALCYGNSQHHEVIQQSTFNVYMAGSTSFVVDNGDFSGYTAPGGSAHDHFFLLCIRKSWAIYLQDPSFC
uniref:Polyprotein n=1 Tax=Chrysanthemum nepovirus TaxID=3115762 RepID=A0AAT9JAU5_9SECO